MVIRVIRPIPFNRRGWCRQTHCRILAGCYETASPDHREVYVAEQVGEIDGWSNFEWDGTTPPGAARRWDDGLHRARRQ